jgi:hypothetical protein
MTNDDLRTIGRAIAEMMAKANSSTPPDIEIEPGTSMAAVFALAGDVAQFIVGTPFGHPVRVTISKYDGMFGD